MNQKNKLLRSLCGFLAAIMLFTCIGVPETAEAAQLPYYIKINRQQNCVTVYALDSKGKYTKPVKSMACSTGVNKATPLGTFSIPAKYRWHQLMGGVYGQYCSRINGGVLFHSVFYNGQDPSRLAYNSYNRLGQAASHGCVRLNCADAKWIYDNCPVGTKVTIYDAADPGPLGKPNPVRIDVNSPYRGWDPTDPNPKNPWQKMKPTLKGIANKTVERSNKKINLLKGVSARDYLGKELKVKVSGSYTPSKTGKYKITYSATDSKKQKTEKSIYLTVKDTKKPSISLKKKTITLNNSMSKKDLVNKIRSCVKAVDLGKKLSASHIYVKADKLYQALKEKKYGTYKVSVYAKDAAGNKSEVLTITVKFVNPNPEPVTPTEPTTPTVQEFKPPVV